MGIVELKDKNISNLNYGLFEVEQIFYTVDYLLENRLVKIELHQIGSNIPDFNPENFIKVGVDKYLVSQMHAMPQFLQNYWGIELVVNPIYSKFVSNGYKTDEEVDKSWNRWLPFITAIVAATVTAMLTALLTLSPIINCL